MFTYTILRVCFVCPWLILLLLAALFCFIQAEIFPDKDDGGRVFFDEAILNSLDIPQVGRFLYNCFIYVYI